MGVWILVVRFWVSVRNPNCFGNGTYVHRMITERVQILDVDCNFERFELLNFHLKAKAIILNNFKFQHKAMAPKKVCILGSGNWGSTIACLVGQNAAKYPDKFVPEVIKFFIAVKI